jgi:hypothetical protein
MARRVALLSIVIATIFIAFTTWFALDRTTATATLCKGGLPNISRPSVVESSELSCAVLGPKVRVTGILTIGFETANFEAPQLGPAPTQHFTTGATWFSGVISDDRALQHQLSMKIAGLCGTRLATVTVEGWPTVSAGHYGHNGLYSRTFFADRVLSVAPPPTAFVSKMRSRYANAGIDSTRCDEP